MKQIIIVTGIIIILLTSNVNAKNINQTIGIKDIIQINLNFKIGRVNIYEGDCENINIKGKITGNSSKGLEIKKINNIINIKQKLGFVPIKYGKTEIFVEIPSNYNKNISVNQSTGKLIINKLNLDSLNIKCTAASVDINDIVFKSLILKTGSGWSNINLNKKSGNIKIDSNVGKSVLNVDQIGGDIIFDVGTMGGTIIIPQDSPINVHNSDNKKVDISANFLDEGKYNLYLKPGVGKIKVNN